MVVVIVKVYKCKYRYLSMKYKSFSICSVFNNCFNTVESVYLAMSKIEKYETHKYYTVGTVPESNKEISQKEVKSIS